MSNKERYAIFAVSCYGAGIAIPAGNPSEFKPLLDNTYIRFEKHSIEQLVEIASAYLDVVDPEKLINGITRKSKGSNKRMFVVLDGRLLTAKQLDHPECTYDVQLNIGTEVTFNDICVK